MTKCKFDNEEMEVESTTHQGKRLIFVCKQCGWTCAKGGDNHPIKLFGGKIKRNVDREVLNPFR